MQKRKKFPGDPSVKLLFFYFEHSVAIGNVSASFTKTHFSYVLLFFLDDVDLTKSEVSCQVQNARKSVQSFNSLCLKFFFIKLILIDSHEQLMVVGAYTNIAHSKKIFGILTPKHYQRN